MKDVVRFYNVEKAPMDATMMKALREAIETRAGVQGPPLAKALGLSKNGFYSAVKRGEIRTVRIGRRLIVPADEARRLLGWEAAA